MTINCGDLANISVLTCADEERVDNMFVLTCADEEHVTCIIYVDDMLGKFHHFSCFAFQLIFSEHGKEENPEFGKVNHLEMVKTVVCPGTGSFSEG